MVGGSLRVRYKVRIEQGDAVSAIMSLRDGEEALLTTGDAARILHISPVMLRRIADQGKIRVTKTLTGQRLFRLADVHALLRERQNRPYRFGRPLNGGLKPK